MKKSFSISELEQIAKEMYPLIAKADPFVVWLHGDLGAGKTTLTRALLRVAGLNPKTPVLSPTYTYYQIYEIDGKNYVHCDFYRLTQTNFVADFEHIPNIRGYFIEWPEKFSEMSATVSIKLSYVDENTRAIEFIGK